MVVVEPDDIEVNLSVKGLNDAEKEEEGNKAGRPAGKRNLPYRHLLNCSNEVELREALQTHTQNLYSKGPYFHRDNIHRTERFECTFNACPFILRTITNLQTKCSTIEVYSSHQHEHVKAPPTRGLPEEIKSSLAEVLDRPGGLTLSRARTHLISQGLELPKESQLKYYLNKLKSSKGGKSNFWADIVQFVEETRNAHDPGDINSVEVVKEQYDIPNNRWGILLSTKRLRSLNHAYGAVQHSDGSHQNMKRSVCTIWAGASTSSGSYIPHSILVCSSESHSQHISSSLRITYMIQAIE